MYEAASRQDSRQPVALARFGEFALRSDSLDDILTEACKLIGDALGTELAKVMELTNDGALLKVRAGVGWNPGVVGHVVIKVAEHTSEAHALKTGEPMISPDIDTETRFRYPHFLIEHGVKAVANVVIIGPNNGSPFGVLQIDSKSPRRFTDDDIVFLRSYANLLAAAVERLRGLDEIRRARDLLETSVADRTRELLDANARLRREAEERQRIEEALRQSHKMEAVGQLTGGIAHDFNNMLQGISSSLELMKRRVEHNRPDEAAQMIDGARTTVNRAASLTNRLLAFSRRQALDPQLVDPNVLVGGLQELIQRAVGPGVMVNVLPRDGVWSILCDPNQLENVLLNLAINSRDAMPQGGTLTISTRDVPLSAADVAGHEGVQPGDYVELAVSDTGVGMDDITRQRAFEPFFTTKPLGQGTGLGLSQLYGFVTQSGGLVRLESAVGEGTTVRLYMPRHAPAEQSVELASLEMAHPDVSGNVVVLLVEDEDQIRTVVSEALRDTGYDVLAMPDGPSALQALQHDTSRRVNILVTDVGLPGALNGRQVADVARTTRPLLPVLFITGYAGSALQDQLSPGMSILTKPFSLDALLSKVRTMVCP